MNILIVDVETTTSNNGHFRDSRNKLVEVGVKVVDKQSIASCFRVLDKDYRSLIQQLIDDADLIVGFNIKFDLHWLRNYGITFNTKRIWDCQIAEFILESQTNPYPSLNQALEKYGFEPKLDVVKTEYWDKGIDTDEIPRDILCEYLEGDLYKTEQVFLKQWELFKTTHKDKCALFKLACADLLVLEDMEYNGIRFNTQAAREEAKRLDEDLFRIKEEIRQSVDCPEELELNLNSNDQLSAILYGGTITQTFKEPCGVFKSGQKVGQIKYKNVDKSFEFKRIFEPLDRTETKKSIKQREEGLPNATSWSVDKDTLKQLKGSKSSKHVLTLILEYGRIEKLKGTYLEGFSDLIEEMNWPENMLHGNLNQCSVVTGRLSSTKPNLQNIDPQTKKFLESRYLMNAAGSLPDELQRVDGVVAERLPIKPIQNEVVV